MADHETIDQMFGRFQTITNSLRSLGKVYENKDHVRKILRSLSKKWRPKVTAIQETKDLNTLSLEELLGSLKVHELELNEEDSSRKEKFIALKAKKPSSSKSLKAEESSEDANSADDESNSDEDELSLISRKIQHLWKKKRGFRGRQFNKRFVKDKPDQKDKSAPVCFECKKPGHFKADCPDLKDKKKPDKRRKGLMVSWDDLDLSSSEEEQEDHQETANLCLMGSTDSDSDFSESEVTDTSDILSAYNELLHNSSILANEYRALKKKYKHLKNEHNNLLSEFEIKSSSDSSENLDECLEHSSKVTCEAPKLKLEVTYLKDTVSKLVGGSEKLNLILSHVNLSRTPYDKSGLGY